MFIFLCIIFIYTLDFSLNGGWQTKLLTGTLTPLIPSTPSSYDFKNPTLYSGQSRKQGSDIRCRALQPKLVYPRTVRRDTSTCGRLPIQYE